MQVLDEFSRRVEHLAWWAGRAENYGSVPGSAAVARLRSQGSPREPFNLNGSNRQTLAPNPSARPGPRTS